VDGNRPFALAKVAEDEPRTNSAAAVHRRWQAENQPRRSSGSHRHAASHIGPGSAG
jgi:hypothetical protein